MSPQVINVNRKKYAVGLFWQPIATGTTGWNYARSLARKIDRKVNLFAEYRAMVGLGASRNGQSGGMAAGAPEVMESFAEFSSFLSAFAIEGKFWIVAVRNGIILSDELFDDENSARAAFAKLFAMPDWGAVFAPGIWAIPRALERNILDVINGNTRATLHATSKFRVNILSISIIALFIIGVGYLFREPIMQMIAPRPQIAKINPELAAEYKRQVEASNAVINAQMEINQPAPPVFLMPYEIMPDPILRAQLCYQAIGFVMQNIPGWVQTNAECNDTHAIANLTRGFGTLGDFYEVVSDIIPSVLIDELSNSQIRVTATLPALPPVASLEEKDVITIVREVGTAFQRVGESADVSTTVDTIVSGDMSVDLNVVEIGAQSKLTPVQFMKIFDGLSGVYMTRAAWDVRSRNWNYEVIIYAK